MFLNTIAALGIALLIVITANIKTHATRASKLAAYVFALLAMLGVIAKAATYQHCEDRSLKKCSEVTKGEAITIKARDDKAIIIKVDFQQYTKKGTLTNE